MTARLAFAGVVCLLASGSVSGVRAQTMACDSAKPVATAAVSGDDYSPERLAARAEIADRVADWARAIDRRDWPLARSLFHPNATVNHGGATTVQALADALALRHRDVPMSAHHVTTQRIVFVNDALALSEAYVLAVQRTPGKPGRYAVTSGRYLDRFERRCGHWKIADRATIFDGAASFPIVGDGAPPPGWVVGVRGPEDLSQARREALGVANVASQTPVAQP